MPLLKENIMKLRRSGALCAAAIALGTAVAAHADVTVTVSSTYDSPQLRKMFQSAPAAQQKAMLSQGFGKPRTSVTYIQGGRIRQDDHGHSSIIDTTGHKMVLLDQASHTYLAEPFNPKSPPPQVQKPDITVSDTGKTKQLLGHTVHIYKIGISVAKAKQSLNMEVWVAPDLPRPPYDPILNNPESPAAGKTSKIKGYPLKIIARVVTPMGTNTVTQTATAISVKPLPASLFTIPSGYKQFTPPPGQQQPSLVPQK